MSAEPASTTPGTAGVSRRLVLAGLLVAGGGHEALAASDRPGAPAVPGDRRRPAPARLAATWQDSAGHRAGLLEARDGRLQVLRSLALPTRAHGIAQAGDDLLLVARRPGDWLVRWNPRTGTTRWLWNEAGRSFNGHVRLDPGGAFAATTETDGDSGEGWIVLRETGSLRKLAEFPSGGRDPHDLAFDRDGTLLVANGGILHLPESGRARRDLAAMDSSLVRLDPGSGRLLGQWRLPQQRLGMRHLAWGAGGSQRILGIALQAEHDDAGERARAPVLALFDGGSLRTADIGQPLGGYGGDIAATASGGFAVSCPRNHAAMLFSAAGRPLAGLPLPSACALAAAGDALWIGGEAAAGRHGSNGNGNGGWQPLASALRLDNHWLPVARAAG